MIDFSIKPLRFIRYKSFEIASFISNQSQENIDWETVESFGEEWTKFSHFSEDEIKSVGGEYFDIIPDGFLNQDCNVLDVGCGSGRWSKYLAKSVGNIEAIDPSKAVFVAKELLLENRNVRVSQASVDSIPFKDNSFDFVFSLGVLHHIPDTADAMKKCVSKLKVGGLFLVYLYYNVNVLPFYLRLFFHISSLFRNIIYRMPYFLKKVICDLIAFVVYVPLAYFSKLIETLFPNKNWYRYIPLWYYRNKSLNVIRNDSLDRFGTPLEQRFSKEEVRAMMESANLGNIQFSDNSPYWHAIGQKLG